MPNHELTRRNELNARPMLGVGYARMARLSVPRVTSRVIAPGTCALTRPTWSW